MKINYEQECNYLKNLKSSMPLLPDPQSLVDEKKTCSPIKMEHQGG